MQASQSRCYRTARIGINGAAGLVQGPTRSKARRMMGSMLPRRAFTFALITALSCFVSASSAQHAQPSAFAGFHQRFEAEMKVHGIAGGASAIVQVHVPATEFFYGEARRDTHQAVDSGTAYNWASITKTMTAIAILQLRDRGRLSSGAAPGARCLRVRRRHHDPPPADAQRGVPESDLALGLRRREGLR